MLTQHARLCEGGYNMDSLLALLKHILTPVASVNRFILAGPLPLPLIVIIFMWVLFFLPFPWPAMEF